MADESLDTDQIAFNYYHHLKKSTTLSLNETVLLKTAADQLQAKRSAARIALTEVATEVSRLPLPERALVVGKLANHLKMAAPDVALLLKEGSAKAMIALGNHWSKYFLAVKAV